MLLPRTIHNWNKNIHFPVREINRDGSPVDAKVCFRFAGEKLREIRCPFRLPFTPVFPNPARASIQKHDAGIRASYDERIMGVLCANIFSPISVRANRRCNYAFQLMKQSPPRPCYLVVSVDMREAERTGREREREGRRDECADAEPYSTIETTQDFPGAPSYSAAPQRQPEMGFRTRNLIGTREP